mgnify:CR=1 FL=1
MIKEDFVADVSRKEVKDKILIDLPYSLELLKRLKKTTNARLGIGRAGDRFKTETLLKFVVGDLEINDDNWADFRSTCESLGVDDCVKIYQDALDNYNK